MAVRKFNDITYPVPGKDTAIEMLRPGAKFALGTGKVGSGNECVILEDPENREKPTEQEILDELERERRIWDYYEYERNRSANYPLWFDQLDMLYHDIKNGNLENGKWIHAIEDVKESFPKPEGTVPA